MSGDDDLIDQSSIDAYRKEGAPPGFAERVQHAAIESHAPRGREIKWAIPALAVLAIAVVLWNGADESEPSRAPSLAVSFSSLPSGLPNLSNTNTRMAPSLASLSPIPARPVIGISVPSINEIKPGNRQRIVPQTRTN